MDRRLSAVVLLAMLTLGALALPPAAAQAEPLSLRAVEPQPLGGLFPGGAATWGFLVENPRDTNASVSASVNESTGSLRVFIDEGGFLAVPAGGAHGFNVTVAVPEDAPVGRYDLRAELREMFAGGEPLVHAWTVDVRPLPLWNVSISTPREAVPPRGETNLTITLENHEASAVTLQLRAEAPGMWPLTLVLEDEHAYVAPGATLTRNLHVTLPRDGSSSWSYTVRVEATRVDGDGGMRYAQAHIRQALDGERTAPPPPPQPMMAGPSGPPTRLDSTATVDALEVWPGRPNFLGVRVEVDGGPGEVQYRLREAQGRLDLSRSYTGTLRVFPTFDDGSGLAQMISIEVPRETPEGEYTLLADFWWTDNRSIRDNLTVLLRVQANDLQFEVAPPVVLPHVVARTEPPELAVPVGGEARGVLVLESFATPQATVLVRLAPAEGGYRIMFDEQTLHLSPGGDARVGFTVRAPAGAAPGEKARAPFVLRAAPEDNGDGGGNGATVVQDEAVDVIVVAPPPPPGDALASMRALGAFVQAYPMATGGIAIAGAALAVAPLWRREWWRYLLMTPLLPLYTRLAKRDVLEHKTRERIHQMILDQPGIHYTALKAATGLNAGALVHHLRTLERHGLATSRREGILRRFYPVGQRLPPAPAVPLTPTQARILELLEREPMTQRQLAEALGITQQGVSYHVKTLERKGQLLLDRDGNEWRYHRVHALEVEEQGATVQ